MHGNHNKVPAKTFAALRALICTAGVLLLFPFAAQAHELWVLTPDQVLDWNSRPKPSTYTSYSTATVVVLIVALCINLVLVKLNASGARELFPALRAQLRSKRDLTSVVLRICLAWVLLSSAFALEPRFGNNVFSEPTLLAPDLTISSLPQHWQWLVWMEIALGISLLAGIYVRVAAAGCLLLVGITIFTTGIPSLAYAPSFIGVAVYLIVAGGGSWFIPLPQLARTRKSIDKLVNNRSISRAQFSLRVLAGLNFLYLAIYFKVMQPNLTLAIIDVHQLPVMGFNPEVFLLVMAAVEVSIGLLVIFGVLLRFLSVVLIGAFVFFAICLSEAENLTSHMLYYGVAISFLFNGNGRLFFAKAKDHAAHIVVVGNGLAAVVAIRRLEALLPVVSNVRLTLVTERTDYQFSAMLPEVVSGAMSPSSIVHPKVKVLERAKLRLGLVSKINSQKRCLHFADESTLDYDQLVFAQREVPDQSIQNNYTGSVFQLDTVSDALRLKGSILHKAVIASNDPDSYQALARFAIFGGGERGSALAVELSALIENLKVDRLIKRNFKPKLVMFEDDADIAQLSKRMLAARASVFKKCGIQTVNTSAVLRLTDSTIVLKSGASINIGNIINLRNRAPLEILPPESIGDQLFDEALNLNGHTNIWMATLCEESAQTATLANGVRQRRLSLRIEQASIAAFNAWAHSQKINGQRFTRRKQKSYQFYMGRHTISSWQGLPIPGWIGRTITRVRFLNQMPSMERKLRVCLDWAFDLVFSNDQTVLLDNPSTHDYALLKEQPLPQSEKTVVTNVNLPVTEVIADPELVYLELRKPRRAG